MDSSNDQQRLKVYKAQSAKGLYHFLHDGKTCPGQRPNDKKPFDLSLYDEVDASERAKLRATGDAITPKKNPIRNLDVTNVDFDIKPKITPSQYESLFLSKGWSLTAKARSVYYKSQKPLDEISAYIDKLSETHPDKGTITFDSKTNNFTISNKSHKKAIAELSDSVSALTVSE